MSRVFFEFRGVIEPRDGALEMTADGRTLSFDGASDGESLRVRGQPWHDPFEGQDSAENREFLASSGHWRRTQVSDWEGYRDIKGHVITDVRLLENQHGRIAGVRIAANDKQLWFVVEGDQCHVYWSQPDGFSKNSE